jgi:hypothetical protein
MPHVVDMGKYNIKISKVTGQPEAKYEIRASQSINDNSEDSIFGLN